MHSPSFKKQVIILLLARVKYKPATVYLCLYPSFTAQARLVIIYYLWSIVKFYVVSFETIVLLLSLSKPNVDSVLLSGLSLMFLFSYSRDCRHVDCYHQACAQSQTTYPQALPPVPLSAAHSPSQDKEYQDKLEKPAYMSSS
jgi:hypothetical protein